MESTNNVVHEGNSIISIEALPGYPDPVVVKRPTNRPSSRRDNRSLEREYEMTRSLDAVEGVRKVLGQQSIDGKPALILEYVDGQTGRVNRDVDASHPLTNAEETELEELVIGPLPTAPELSGQWSTL